MSDILRRVAESEAGWTVSQLARLFAMKPESATALDKIEDAKVALDFPDGEEEG